MRPLHSIAFVAADFYTARMRKHWKLSSVARSAVIQADLPGARAAGEALASLTYKIATRQPR